MNIKLLEILPRMPLFLFNRHSVNEKRNLGFINCFVQSQQSLAVGINYTISIRLWSFSKTSDWINWWYYVLPDASAPDITYNYVEKKVTFSWTSKTFKDMTLVVWSSALNSSSRQTFLSSNSLNIFEVILEEGIWYWSLWFPSVAPQIGYPELQWLFLTPIEIRPSYLRSAGGVNSGCDGNETLDLTSETYISGFDEKLVKFRIGPTDTVS